jgi:hypothetical protein
VELPRLRDIRVLVDEDAAAADVDHVLRVVRPPEPNEESVVRVDDVALGPEELGVPPGDLQEPVATGRRGVAVDPLVAALRVLDLEALRDKPDLAGQRVEARLRGDREERDEGRVLGLDVQELRDRLSAGGREDPLGGFEAADGLLRADGKLSGRRHGFSFGQVTELPR